MKALVVDDSKVMRLMVIRALRQANLVKFDCDEAPNGKVALELFEANDYEIVFIDYNMPEMSGLEFLEQVRAGSKAHVPVVMITSEKTEAIQGRIAQAGASGYISKPFTPDRLEEVLEPLLQAMDA